MVLKKVDDREEEMIEAKAKALGFDSFFSPPINEPRNKHKNSEFGLCSTCSYFGCARSDTKIIFTWCEEFRRPVSSSDPIVDCTYYTERKASLSLSDMMSIATVINKNRRDVGFLSKELKGDKNDMERKS